MNINNHYSLFFNFIKKYSQTGFLGIDPDDPTLIEMEALMENNDQFFFIGDIIKMKILFTSNRSVEMIGIAPEEVTPYHFFEATHPDDIQRHDLARSKLFGISQGLFIAEKGDAILSTNLKIRNPLGGFTQMLFQCYMFYLPAYRTVFILQIHTGIDWYKKTRHGYHYYNGSDLSQFRYPDEKLLAQGNVFSDREFEIIRLIKSGMSSEQIAEKLFLSRHTVNTHRNNILEKTGKSAIADVIYDLIERGLLK
jgi:hypothetical protein